MEYLTNCTQHLHFFLHLERHHFQGRSPTTLCAHQQCIIKQCIKLILFLQLCASLLCKYFLIQLAKSARNLTRKTSIILHSDKIKDLRKKYTYAFSQIPHAALEVSDNQPYILTTDKALFNCKHVELNFPYTSQSILCIQKYTITYLLYNQYTQKPLT